MSCVGAPLVLHFRSIVLWVVIIRFFLAFQRRDRRETINSEY